MRISASISTIPLNKLSTTVQQLDEAGIDAYHLDSVESREIFQFADRLRGLTKKPFDLHLITSDPVKYWDEIRNSKIEATTLQLESLHSPLFVPQDLKGKVGLAVLASTPITAFEVYRKNVSWLLIMMTTPGYSGGKFQPEHFANIIRYREAYPEIPVYIDGGVTHEVAYVLRMIGIRQIVSGSYLFSGTTVEESVQKLQNYSDSPWMLKDIMAKGTEFFSSSRQSFGVIAETSFINENGENINISRDANWTEALEQITAFSEVNGKALFVHENLPLAGLDTILSSLDFPANYFFAVNDQHAVTGSLFFNPEINDSPV
jgi:ribulose-phosphate 3-epimerase